MSQIHSKGFDFSALFSSPGLSILRDDKDDSQQFKEKWVGFTYLAAPDAFDARSDDITRVQLKTSIGGSTPAPAYPCTPARSSVSPYGIASTTKRRHNVEGLKEIVTYGILKTAKKAGAATVKKRQQAQTRTNELDALDARQRKLLSDVGGLEARYKELLERATALPTTS
jgi:hypothetical protein